MRSISVMFILQPYGQGLEAWAPRAGHCYHFKKLSSFVDTFANLCEHFISNFIIETLLYAAI